MSELRYSVTQSLRIYYKKEISVLKQCLNKIYLRCVDWFCPINPAFWDFCSNVHLESLTSNKGKCNFVKIRKLVFFVSTKRQNLGIWV